MLYSVLALAVFVAGVTCTSEAEYQTAFTNWMQQYGKSYSSAEFLNKYNVFKVNLDYVNQWNANNELTKLETNFLADLTNEEYKRIYLGTKFDGSSRLASAKPGMPLLGLPTSVDWTKKGVVTPVKNQQQCGSCWSFSTTGSVEGIHAIKTGNLVSCSEQQLVDCSGSYGNQGCNGGLMDDAFKYIIAVGGLDSEKSYPYTATTGDKCLFKKKNIVASITGYQDIPSGDENTLTSSIVQQPISVAIDASHQSFQLYSSGVYYEPDCSTTQLDHGVLAVGFGTDGSNAYYIVKNSWGASWGQSGYLWMSRNRSNNCGISTMASYPTDN